MNISRDTEEALRETMASEGVSATEALRRLVGYGIVVYRADKAGAKTLLRYQDGVLERVVLVD